jgi:hypothetical protein
MLSHDEELTQLTWNLITLEGLERRKDTMTRALEFILQKKFDVPKQNELDNKGDKSQFYLPMPPHVYRVPLDIWTPIETYENAY